MGLQAPPIANFKGKWLKDRDASQMTKYSRQLDLLQLGGIQKRTAMYLIHGLDISQDDTTFTAKFIVAKVPFFKPTEKYLIDKEVTMKRRDLRGGAQTCTMRPVDRGLQVDIQWPEPCAGSLTETYTSPEDGVLHVYSVTRVNGEEQECLQVYRKGD